MDRPKENKYAKARGFAQYLWEEWCIPAFYALVLAIILRTFIIAPFRIPTGSMIPTLMIGDRLLVSKIHYGVKVPFTQFWAVSFGEPNRGDIIVFRFPYGEKKDFIKRLIAFGGERVEIRNKDVYVNGEMVVDPPMIKSIEYYNTSDPGWGYGWKDQEFTVPEGHYFVLGDNSQSSNDSRSWGFVPENYLIGKAVFIYWPPNRIRYLKGK